MTKKPDEADYRSMRVSDIPDPPLLALSSKPSKRWGARDALAATVATLVTLATIAGVGAGIWKINEAGEAAQRAYETRAHEVSWAWLREFYPNATLQCPLIRNSGCGTGHLVCTVMQPQEQPFTLLCTDKGCWLP